jgi:AcrR family transcriptional regulator
MKISDEPTRREHRHQSTRDEVMEVARRQMAEQGAAALSLREIARQMRLTAPALYRYFASRDDLVTALIVTAYDSLADALEAARDTYPCDAYAERLLAACFTYRKWSLAHPQDYALIFGTPIPGYHAPDEITMPAAKRSMDVFVGLIETARQAGRLKPAPTYAKPPSVLQSQLSHWKKSYGYAESTLALHLALVGWSRLHGLVSLELFNQIEPIIANPLDLYSAQVVELLQQSGFAASEISRKIKDSRK